MYTEGSVILFNAIPQAVDIFLNDAFLTRMKPAKADHNYAPYPPVTVDRIASEGYPNVRRYAGGLADWEAAGYSLEEGSL